MNCDSLATTYRWWEYISFGNQLQECRTACLDYAEDHQRALILGEGDGRFLQQLIARNPEIQVDCVDSSPAMIALAQARILRTQPDHRVTFHQADAHSVALPPQTYDLVVTHFFLDCFDAAALQRLTKKIANSLKPNAIWLLADFQIPPTGLARIRARLWLVFLYTFFALTTQLNTRQLHDPTQELGKNGLVCLKSVKTGWKLLKSEAWRLNSADSATPSPAQF